MHHPFLLSRVLLRFNDDDDDLIKELSAAALSPDGSLWLGSDEFLTVERLSPLEPCVFGEHKAFPVGEYLDLFDAQDEIDIEGMDCSAGYLWLTGSHSSKRKQPKGKKAAKDLKRLTSVVHEANRYILGRIPVIQGELFRSYDHPERPGERTSAACLEKTADANALIEALRDDPHLGPFLSIPLPSKENGFDIEGLAVRGDTLFLGFRGPVLRGWAVILEIAVEEREPGVLVLKAIGPDGQCYKKHFVNLDGLGVRELCLRGDDLIILAGPTMDLPGNMRLFLLKDALDLPGDSVTAQDKGRLELLFHLDYGQAMGNAEGLALYPCLGQPDGLLVVYDAPQDRRKPDAHSIYMDVFRLRGTA